MVRARRSYDLTRDLTTLLVCAVSTVLLTRSFLALAGYPQVGGSKFHIAHVLYGGLLLTAACVSLLAFLSPTTKIVAAVLGGIGFGLFIDEVGKFVTKNVNYFYKPAFAIIYVCFIVLFGVIRWLGRRGFSADEAVLIALESLQREAVGDLSDEHLARSLALLKQTGATGPLAEGVRDLLEQAHAKPADDPGFLARLTVRARDAWATLTAHPRFRQLIVALLLGGALVSAGELAWLLRNGFGSLTFSQQAFALTTLAVDAMLLVGALYLESSVLVALHWYEHAVLLEIVVGQVFLYSSEQLAATLNLAALLILWGLLHWGIHFETARS
ncbi:MAG TPA: hypothetical protein VG652_04745 [Gaiellaceae bacterium]|nr:hypothetical protein [Gaiellaceae bacterium]